MQALINGTVIAEAPDADIVSIEGNAYFPPSSLNQDAFSNSDTQYNCPWKGDAQYHDVTVGGELHHDAAWSYPQPYESSFDRVGQDYSGYVAFDKQQVTVG